MGSILDQHRVGAKVALTFVGVVARPTWTVDAILHIPASDHYVTPFGAVDSYEIPEEIPVGSIFKDANGYVVQRIENGYRILLTPNCTPVIDPVRPIAVSGPITYLLRTDGTDD